MRARVLVPALVLSAGALVLGACDSSSPPAVAQAPGVALPPAQPYPGVQTVPQLPATGADNQAISYCLLPVGSEMRVFYLHASHGDGSLSVVNTHDLPPTNPWKCP